jgi:hypothetical protein
LYEELLCNPLALALGILVISNSESLRNDPPVRESDLNVNKVALAEDVAGEVQAGAEVGVWLHGALDDGSRHGGLAAARAAVDHKVRDFLIIVASPQNCARV